jgi:hypothetical protein
MSDEWQFFYYAAEGIFTQRIYHEMMYEPNTPDDPLQVYFFRTMVFINMMDRAVRGDR